MKDNAEKIHGKLSEYNELFPVLTADHFGLHGSLSHTIPKVISHISRLTVVSRAAKKLQSARLK